MLIRDPDKTEQTLILLHAAATELDARGICGSLAAEIAAHMSSLTEGLDEHPGEWDGACLCATCRSYG